MYVCRLKSNTVALRIAAAPSTHPGVPFGYVGRQFTRDPVVLVIGEGFTRGQARACCAQHELVTDQLTAEDLAAEPAATTEPAEPAATRGKKRRK